MNLETPIKDAGRNFTMYTRRLEKLGIKTVADLLYHLPFRYEDYSLISPIDKLQAGEVVTIRGTVMEIKNIFTKRFKNLQKAIVGDETAEIEVTWFNQPFLLKNIHKGDRISIAGKIDLFGKTKVVLPSEYEVLNDAQPIHTGRLVPIYAETRGVSSKWLRNRIAQLLSTLQPQEFLPNDILAKHQLLPHEQALNFVHFPKNIGDAVEAKRRLAFDELLLVHLASLKRRADWEKALVGNPFSIAKYRKEISLFWERLPFELTRAQKSAVKDIFKDLASKKPMNRLLEGDVGSGKTVVAAIAMYLASLNGFQSVLMAPTEILAQQHFNTISNLLIPFGVTVELITHSRKSKGTAHIIVGTHAVLFQNINVENLGVVIIDEQQRFGVEQRALMRKKGENPHFLTMTATPIPRTVALTLYGDLDLSFLDEMPTGRKIVKTWLVPPEKRDAAYEWIREEIKTTIGNTKNQVFIICPFIEESETLQSVKAATLEYDRLKKQIFEDLHLGLLHGRLKTKEKEEILTKFRKGELDILVATPVVEVGIDIPNATIMVVEAAERFGLAQLHQLRGRVGRSVKDSYCLLFTESKSPPTLLRLKALETIHVGAELAELDLKLRGPGEIYGTMQHGIRNLKAASFSDFPLIEETRRQALELFPKLHSFQRLQERLNSLTIQKVAPD